MATAQTNSWRRLESKEERDVRGTVLQGEDRRVVAFDFATSKFSKPITMWLNQENVAAAIDVLTHCLQYMESLDDGVGDEEPEESHADVA